MEIKKSMHFKTRIAWRKWLSENHNKERELWLVFYKKHTGVVTIPYDDSVEEALCFGWIDSIIQKIDDEKYARKFTPRTNSRKWSEPNKKRLKKMIAARKLTPAGMKAADKNALNAKTAVKKKPAALFVPDYIADEVAKNEKASEYFSSLAPSHKRLFIGWIDSAVKKETKSRRLAEAIRLLAAGKKLGMK